MNWEELKELIQLEGMLEKIRERNRVRKLDPISLLNEKQDLASLLKENAAEDVDFLLDAVGKTLRALREIDTHIRSTPEPIPYIVSTLKDILPEYQSSRS